MDAAANAASEEAEGLAAQAHLPELSLSAREGVDRADQSHSTRLGELLCRGSFQPVLLVHSRLGREEGSGSLGEESPASGLWMEAVA